MSPCPVGAAECRGGGVSVVSRDRRLTRQRAARSWGGLFSAAFPISHLDTGRRSFAHELTRPTALPRAFRLS